MLPNCTLAAKEEDSAPGNKKNRVTILACSNVTGNNKLKLGKIGKSHKTRAFKHFKEHSALLVWYRKQNNAWMNCAIFKERFNQQFVPCVEKFSEENNLPKKAVLLLNNAPSHLSADELRSGEIKCIFLPPNNITLSTPGSECSRDTSNAYIAASYSVVIAGMDAGKCVSQSLKGVDMLDVAS